MDAHGARSPGPGPGLGLGLGPGLGLGLRLGLCLGLGLGFGPVFAQDAPLGWTDAAPALDTAAEHVTAIAVGAAHDEDGPLAAARLAARRRGEARAREALHRWVDDGLARASAGPREAQAVHDALERSATVSRVRARADGSAIVELSCPLQALRAAFDHPRCPWHREGPSR